MRRSEAAQGIPAKKKDVKIAQEEERADAAARTQDHWPAGAHARRLSIRCDVLVKRCMPPRGCTSCSCAAAQRMKTGARARCRRRCTVSLHRAFGAPHDMHARLLGAHLSATVESAEPKQCLHCLLETLAGHPPGRGFLLRVFYCCLFLPRVAATPQTPDERLGRLDCCAGCGRQRHRRQGPVLAGFV